MDIKNVWRHVDVLRGMVFERANEATTWCAKLSRKDSIEHVIYAIWILNFAGVQV